MPLVNESNPTITMVNNAMQQLQLAENRATELEQRFGEVNAANDSTALRIQELVQLRVQLETRVTELEKEARKIVAAQPEIIVEGLKRWMATDPKGLAKALTAFLGEAVS